MGILKDLTGQVFGLLTVIKRSGSDKYRHSVWECQCECGRVSYTLGTSLVTGHTKSCGCQESLHEKNPRPIKVPTAPLRRAGIALLTLLGILLVIPAPSLR